jgi:hypothetical protein
MASPIDRPGSICSGASSEAIRSLRLITRRTSALGRSIRWAISSTQMSGPLADSSWRMARRTRLISLTTCTGRRMVRDWFMIARSMLCRIHQVA